MNTCAINNEGDTITATIIAFPDMCERNDREFDRTGSTSYIRAIDEAHGLLPGLLIGLPIKGAVLPWRSSSPASPPSSQLTTSCQSISPGREWCTSLCGMCRAFCAILSACRFLPRGVRLAARLLSPPMSRAVYSPVIRRF